MSRWDFKSESLTDAAGANTFAGQVAGNQPHNEADSLASKRNVVLTEKGWVRRQVYYDTHGNLRTKEEVLVAAHPGSLGANGGYSNAAFSGTADVAQVHLGANTADNLAFNTGVVMSVEVVYNEPVLVGDATQITASNTTLAGTAFTLAAVANNSTTGANNVITYQGAPAAADVYKIGAQTIANVSVISTQNHGNTAANGVITGAVSNTLLNHLGTVVGSFTVV